MLESISVSFQRSKQIRILFGSDCLCKTLVCPKGQSITVMMLRMKLLAVVMGTYVGRS